MNTNFESEVQEAMKILKGEQTPIPLEDEFESEVQEAIEVLRPKNPPDLTAKRAIGLAARGFSEVPAEIIDIASKAAKAGTSELESYRDWIGEKFKKSGKMKEMSPSAPPVSFSAHIPETEIAPKVREKVSSVFGEELTPKTPIEKAISTTGSFLFPVPIPGGAGYIKAAKAGLAPLAKHIGKEATIASGASTALNLTPKASEEGTLSGAAEDLAKVLVGAKAGKIASDIPGKILHPIESSKKGVAKLASRFINPEEAFLSKAEKHEIEVPLNVGANNKAVNFVANNYLKSLYASKKYSEALKRADDSVMEAVKRSIDSLGDANLKPSAASASYAQHLKEEELSFKKQSDELYKAARKSLSEKEGVVPKNTLKALNSEAVRDLVGNLSPSSSEKVVINRIKEISNKLSGAEELLALERYKDINPKQLEKIRKHLSSKKEVPVKELINLRKSLLNSLSYDLEVRGSEAFLSKLVNTLDLDIKTLPNKKFINEYESANRFFRENIGQRFRKSMAESILRKESPVEAYNLMNSVGNITALEKITGHNPKSKELFDSLKKAKAREILSSAIRGELGEAAELNAGALGRLFSRGEKKQELLSKLLGEKEYNNLAEISEIASQFAKDGRELLNTSGTAHVLSDVHATKDMIHQSLRTMLFILGGGYYKGEAGVLGVAALNVVLPNVVSRLLADKQFVSNARAYALARKRGSDKFADSIMRKMVVPVMKTIKESEGEDKE